MAKANRTCFICGNGYHYCPTCSEDRDKPSWYNMFCSEECKDINYILSENNFKRLSNEDAGELLKQIKMPKITIEENRKRVEELLAIKRKPVKKVKPETYISE